MEDLITKCFLKSIFSYHDGCFYWKKVISAHGKIGKRVGCDNGKGYLKVGINKKYYSIHKLMFLYHYGYIPNIVDHIDRDTLNNRPENLRDVSASQNTYNRGIRKDNKSTYKGVSLHKQTGKWQSEIQVNGIGIYLGLFNTPHEAAECYNNAAQRHFKQYAFLNKIIK